MTHNLCSVHAAKDVQRCAIRLCWLPLIALAIISSPAVLHAAATFTPLGLFGGVTSGASDVSADGSVVVGGIVTLPGPTRSAFRWTAEGSMVIPVSLASVPSVAVSADGSTVVSTHLSPNGPEGFRWMEDGTFQGLGVFPSEAFDVSADGRVVVGTRDSTTARNAFRWTDEGGLMELGPAAEIARGVSADGTVVVGLSPAFRWTAEAGTVVLPRIRDTNFLTSGATAVSADGSVVVGYNSFGRLGLGVDEAFRWTEESGTVSLQSLPWTFSVANDVSGDGSVIVGHGIKSNNAAFYWTAETGMVDLQELLFSLGVTNLDGWRQLTATGVSQDGLTIVGSGLHNNRTEAWVATIPEPSTIVLAILGAAGLLAFYIRGARQSSL